MTVTDNFANTMDDVCYDVEMEPRLQPLQGESFDSQTTITEDQVRLNIKAKRKFLSHKKKTSNSAITTVKLGEKCFNRTKKLF